MVANPERGRLVVLCGLPGSGKTTLAHQLVASTGAVRLCPDEWITELGGDLYDEPLRLRVEGLQWSLAQELLGRGLAVVIEWGVWSRAEREVLRERARQLGAAIELRHLDVPIDVLVERVLARNEELPWGMVAISEADLRSWVGQFEAPTAEELARYDPPIG